MYCSSQFTEVGPAGAHGTHAVPVVTEKQGQDHVQIQSQCTVGITVRAKTRRVGRVPHHTVQVYLNVPQTCIHVLSSKIKFNTRGYLMSVMYFFGC